MLMQKDVSLKEMNLLKRKNDLMGISGKSTMSINKPITSEENDMGLTLNKEKSTF